MMLPFCVVLKRTLSNQHPLKQMLQYHCREITIVNAFAGPVLLAESQYTDLLFAYGNTGGFRLLQQTHPLSTWEVTNYRGNIKVCFSGQLTF